MLSHALYYPSIDIKNEQWLKNAVLFWDQISTIVPKYMDTPYKDRSTRILEDNGIVLPYYVDPYCLEVNEIEQDVINYINTSEGKYFIKKRTYASPFPQNEYANKESDFNKLANEYSDFFIHLNKFSCELNNMLKDYANDEGFVGITKSFMNFYMTILANRICQRHNLALLTDGVMVNNVSNKIFEDGLANNRNENSISQKKQGLLYKLVIDNIQIDPSTPIENLIEFKKKRSDELNNLRNEISKLTSFDSSGMDITDIDREIKSIYERFVIPAQNDLRNTLYDARIGWLKDKISNYILTGFIPTFITSQVSIKGAIAVGVCAGIDLIKSLIYYDKNEEMTMRKDPYCYLLRLNNNFAPKR